MTDKTTARVYFYDRSTNGTSVTLQRIDNDDPSSVYTDLPGYPKADTGGYNTFYDNSDTGLAVDTSYSYRAFASNIKGDSAYSTILTVDTVPVKPISVQAAGISDTKIKLTFTDNAHYTSYFQIWGVVGIVGEGQRQLAVGTRHRHHRSQRRAGRGGGGRT